MGYMKRLLQEQEERGYSITENRYVCQNCVTDPVLAEILAAATVDDICSYCANKTAAHISVLLSEVVEAIREDYDHPANVLPYDSSEGRYHGPVYDRYEILDELGDWTDSEEVRVDVAEAILSDEWSEKDYFGLDEYEVLNYGWERFANQIMYGTRYLFLLESENREYSDPNEIPPGKMLYSLGELFLGYGLLSRLRAGTEFIRARVTSKGECPSTAKELGTVHRERAIHSNRMSPAGIPMFYAGMDENTAFRETYDPDRENGCIVVTFGRFRTTRQLILLDLTKLPERPSPFDSTNRGEAKRISFLWNLRDELKKPITKDGREHVEYVPTQAITEYVRHHFTCGEEDNERADGILYPSARHGAGTAVVIFADSAHCGSGMERKGKECEMQSEHSSEESEVFLRLIDIRQVNPSEYLRELSSAAEDV